MCYSKSLTTCTVSIKANNLEYVLSLGGTNHVSCLMLLERAWKFSWYTEFLATRGIIL